jgi:ribosomal protein L28
MTELKLNDDNYILPQITRVDIIVDNGRIQYNNVETTLSIQDDGRTLKVFISTPSISEVDFETKKEKIIKELLNNIKENKK